MQRRQKMTHDEFNEAVKRVFDGRILQLALLLGLSRQACYDYRSGRTRVPRSVAHSLAFIEAIGVEKAEEILNEKGLLSGDAFLRFC